jgi:adenosylcobinamide kinase/adenosylcobinamide-phosphate guanylyltransferase
MGKVILLTGGARSGKSSYAEEIAGKLGDNILYIATSIPYDEEMEYRIKLHVERRPQSWRTLECFKNFKEAIGDKTDDIDGVLLDCITIMITNIMFSTDINCGTISQKQADELEKLVLKEVDGLLEVINKSDKTFILVTNEVGMGLVPEYPLSRAFRDIAGRVNQKLGKIADEVYLCVCGIPKRIK